MKPVRQAGRTIARIQRLCCSGLGGQVVIPAVLRELHDLVPSRGNSFLWASQRLELTNIFAEGAGMAELAPLYLRDFHNRREREVVFTLTEVLKTNYASAVIDFHDRVVKVARSDFLKSDFYNLILRPSGWERALLVKVGRPGRPLGTMQLGRLAKYPDFSRREKGLLEVIAPFVSHALTDHTPADQFEDSDQNGLIIADEKGRIQHLSRSARQLLLMTRHDSWTPSTAVRMRDTVLPDEVSRLCQHLSDWAGDQPLATPPVWRHRNAWGEFVFRAHRMDRSVASPASSLIGISVGRREPLPLKLLRRVNEMSLSHRESQLCLVLVTGQSRAAIAHSLGISEQTVITHCRNLYSKLEVHTRVELVDKLRVT